VFFTPTLKVDFWSLKPANRKLVKTETLREGVIMGEGVAIRVCA